jgi:3',5'-cyclic AMP phosphodiesterase CpdA
MLFAQISDFHLKPRGVNAYGIVDTAFRLERVVEHINRLIPLPDLVLITGDLADEGAAESYELLHDIMSPLKSPFFMVPGNHDHKPSLLNAFQDRAFLTGSIKEHGDAYICYTVEDFPLRFIGLDTVTPGEHGGGLGPVRLAWLEKVLGDRSDAPTVVFMHHPPFASAIGCIDREIFEGRHEFSCIIEKNPHVERVLCGHIHRPVFRRFAGTCATTCPGVGMQLVLDLREDVPPVFILEPPAIMLHYWTDRWDEKALLTHINVVEDHPGQYGEPHPFFNVISPK